MIVAEQKPINEIIEMLKGHTNILIVGCGTCATICFAGGEKEVGILATALRIAAKKAGKELKTQEITIERQCDKEFVQGLEKTVHSAEAILSMGCGAGAQTLADFFLDKTVIPAVNTKFIGATIEFGIWSEKCSCCGNCILDKTAGICPITRCAKSLLNGPCGGSQDGKCEVDRGQDCAWQLIYDRLKARGKLEMLEEIMPPKDWSTGRDGGVRKIVREDLVIEAQKQGK